MKHRFFALSILLISCGEKKDDRTPVPANILDKSQFAELLVDMALAESISNLNIRNVDLSKQDSIYAFDPLREHGVRQTQYDSTLRFYSEHPLYYKQVYDTVLVRLADLKLKRENASKH